ncbi:hypothetical protein TNIN_166711 [Trichonephila inaurata madagascariensis]|uniref:Uncharacterized protein n=1 Tax=Trichonephila inaurata madagascariensis TaxID=2747483 RepID=A0A8X6IK44_9ARAC|nr:hypothetical protein TNIN_166711 [Trichonephila inaurata madagascariensis]
MTTPQLSNVSLQDSDLPTLTTRLTSSDAINADPMLLSETYWILFGYQTITAAYLDLHEFVAISKALEDGINYSGFMQYSA